MRFRFIGNQDHHVPTGLLTSIEDEGEGGEGGGSEDGEKKPEGDVLTFARKTFNERIDRAKRAAQAELLSSMGVSSLDELRELRDAKSAEKDKPKAEGTKEPQGDDSERKALLAERKVLQDRLKAAERQAQEAIEAERTQMRLERSCDKAGIIDSDYALTLLRRHVTSLSPKAADKFDADAWLAELAAKRPHLCTAREEQATTGTGGNGADDTPTPDRGGGRNGAPPPPKPQAKVGQGFNAMSASKADAQRRLEQLKRRV